MLSRYVLLATAPYVLSVEENVTLSSGDTFTVQVDGAAGPGVVGGHDQLNATGSVDIVGSVTLDLVGSPTLSGGESFTIVDRNGGTGTFDGLPDGSIIGNLLGTGLNAQIFYSSSEVVIQTGEANDTTCNGIDDDLDGTADEDYVPVAVTATEITQCVAGTIIHVPTADFGDAPSGYPVLLSESGAWHTAVGPTLGPERDVESSTSVQHSPAADFDDNTGSPDDEDGVTIAANIVALDTTTITVNLQNPDPTQNILNAWIDYNLDGSFTGPDEQIIADQDLGTAAGPQDFNVSIPAAFLGTAAARFRLSTSTGVSSTGGAGDGGVEEYVVTIDSPIIDN